MLLREDRFRNSRGDQIQKPLPAVLSHELGKNPSLWCGKIIWERNIALAAEYGDVAELGESVSRELEKGK